jgi:hypothetical protein
MAGPTPDGRADLDRIRIGVAAQVRQDGQAQHWQGGL